MSGKFSYYQYEGTPCRIAENALGKAEAYQSGVGFVEAPKATILFQAIPISKAEFDKMIVKLARASHAAE